MISAEELSRRYGPTPVVRGVSFTCEPGTVTGFLGPNGAGKSTTLRMITGLTRPDSGRATVAGRPFAELPNPPRVVGTLLDASAMHRGRTGRATLRIAADIAGVSPRRVGKMLDLVGLGGAAGDRRVGMYSLGMRQRLGIAQALIGEPHILLLDEPANGLDPEGIAWMRTLLREFADRGGTVLLSSHLLAEVEATVDRLVVIARGQVVAQGTLDELLPSAGLYVQALDGEALRRMLVDANVPFGPGPDGGLIVDTAGGISSEDIARLAAHAGVVLVELRRSDRVGIEELFFSLTADADPAASGARSGPGSGPGSGSGPGARPGARAGSRHTAVPHVSEVAR